jgi:hypothetical protein
MRVYVFRFAPESEHRAMQSACPFRAPLADVDCRPPDQPAFVSTPLPVKTLAHLVGASVCACTEARNCEIDEGAGIRSDPPIRSI